MHRHHENEYEMYLRDCNWLCVFSTEREKDRERERERAKREMESVSKYVCACVLPWSTPWATASTWQRGLSSDGTSSDIAETDSGYYGNKSIRRQMSPLYKFPLKIYPQYYFQVIRTECTRTSNVPLKSLWIRKNFNEIRNVGTI